MEKKTLLNLSHRWKELVLLIMLLSTLFLTFLGSRALIEPDEARYVEIPREMLLTGDFITPHLNAIKYFEKPALFYWIEAGAYKIFGLNEYGLRLPIALLALLGCLAVFYTANRLFNRKTAFYSALILAASPVYLVMGHVITLDIPVAIFLSSALFAFLLGSQQTTREKSGPYYYIFYVCCALATLTKGLIGFLLPAAIIGLWVLLHNQWRLLKEMRLPTGIIIYLALVIPWHVLIQKSNPEFFQFYFYDQQFGRYLTMNAGRYHPLWFFPAVLIVGFFPWTVFLWNIIKETYQSIRNGNQIISYLAIWTLVIVIFFSLSNSKLIPYILPAFPPLAILAGNFFEKVSEKQTSYSDIACYSLPVISFIAVIASIFARPILENLDTHLGHWDLLLPTMILLIGSSLACYFFTKRHLTSAILSLVIAVYIMFAGAMTVFPHVYKRSIKPIAEMINQLGPNDAEVVSFHSYYQGLPVYLGRTVTVSRAMNELRFGIQHQDTHQWVIEEPELWRRWAGNKTMYLVTNQEFIPHLKSLQPKLTFCLLLINNADILITNKLLPSCQPL